MKRHLLPNPNALLVETTGLWWHLVQAALMAGVVLLALLVALKFESYAIPVLLLVGLLGFVAILARPLLGLLLVIFLIPFEYFQVIPGLDLTGSKLLSMVLVVVVAFHFVVARGSGIRRSPVDLQIGLFLLACIPGVAMAMEPRDAFGKLISLVSYVVLFYLCGSLLRTRRDLLTALWTFWFAVAALVGITILADIGLLRLGGFGGTLTYVGMQLVQRSAGSSANPAVFVMYPMFAACAAFALLHTTKSHLVRLVLLLSLLAFAYRIYLSYTRTAYVALAFTVGGYMYLFHRSRPVAVALILICILGFALSMLPADVIQHFATGLTFGETSSSARIYQVRASIPVFLENPVWGVGLGQIRRYIDGVYVDGVVVDNTLHIQPLSILLDAGLAGFAAYLWILVAFFFRIYSTLRTTKDPVIYPVLVFGVLAFGSNMLHFLMHPLTYFSIFGAIYGMTFAAWAIHRAESGTAQQMGHAEKSEADLSRTESLTDDNSAPSARDVP